MIKKVSYGLSLMAILITSVQAVSIAGQNGGRRISNPREPALPVILDMAVMENKNVPVTTSEYHFGARQDDEVLPGVVTELWAKVYRPADLGNTKHPIIMILHGNHNTCAATEGGIKESVQYTYTGTCPGGSGNGEELVIKNHLGYDYIANKLATFGYFVVSVNANRGITGGTAQEGDFGLNLARGRLILKHLSLLNLWNTTHTAPKNGTNGIGVDLYGKLDFSQVGLMGHSRGGEGVRAAYNLYRDEDSNWKSKEHIPAMTIKAIFEIGPVDGQTERVLNADGVAWNVLLPMCDGDVVHLDGMKPFDRMQLQGVENPQLPKSMFAVWGANHNFYNTEWRISDSSGCVGTQPLFGQSGTSEAQKNTAIDSVIPFFRTFVKNASTEDSESPFNPILPLPNYLSNITNFDRTYSIAVDYQKVITLENFQSVAGVGARGQLHDVNNVWIDHGQVSEHDPSYRAANLAWNGAGPDTFFQNNWLPVGKGYDLTEFATLDFRVGRGADWMNSAPSTDFHIQLVDYDNSLVPLSVPLSSVTTLSGPIGSSINKHITLQSVRIDVARLVDNPGRRIRGIRFVFDGNQTGHLFISDISISKNRTWSSEPQAVPRIISPTEDLPVRDTPVSKLENKTLISVEDTSSDLSQSSPSRSTVQSIHRDRVRASWIEIEVRNDDGFPVRNALAQLHLDGKAVGVGSFSNDGDLRTMVFRINRDNVTDLPDEVNMEIRYREDLNGNIIKLGRVNKSSW